MVCVSKLSLKEAHSGDGVSCIAWDVAGQHILTAGPDARLVTHEWSPTGCGDGIVRKEHLDAITGLAVSPLGNYVATASLDHAVKLYAYPGLRFHSTVSRFTLPIRAVAFSSTGGLLAAAGDDDGIKLISTVDSAIVRVLKGHDSPVLSLAFDPLNEYLASAGSDGTVILWALGGKRIHTLNRAAPDADSCLPGRNDLAWHPNGSLLAVAGRSCDVALHDRDTGEKVFSLEGGHDGEVALLAWSPNGVYLATAGKDRKVFLWDVEKRLDLDSQKFDAQICCLAWRPVGNSLAVIDKAGRFGVWEAAIPCHMTSPTLVLSSAPSLDRKALLNFGDDDALPAESSDAGSDDASEDGICEPLEYETDKAPDELKPGVKRKRKSNWESPVSPVFPPQMQASFQSGSTSQVLGKRRFLTYNMLGSITTFENEGFSHIEVEFHDTGTGTRVPALTDYFGFTMAALCRKGCVLANPRKGEKKPSTLTYRPFNSWANNSEWSVRFQHEEEVKAVAVGTGWVAASTSWNMLRIFSEAGLQRFLMSLAGPVVTMAGHEQLLAVVAHASNPTQFGDQVMEFFVYDVHAQKRMVAGRFPLSPGSTLSWLGFSESGHLSSFDSQGILRVYNGEFDGCWIPLFSAVRERKDAAESYWIVGLNDTQLFCVICKLPETKPQVSPRPVLSVLSLSLPLICSDLGADQLENEYLQGTLALSQARAKADEAASNGEEDEEQEDEVLRKKADLDKCILRLMAGACKGDKLARALELANMLSLHKSMEGALKLANALRLPALAERISSILEGRLAAENADSLMMEEESRSHHISSRPVHHPPLQQPRSVPDPPPAKSLPTQDFTPASSSKLHVSASTIDLQAAPVTEICKQSTPKTGNPFLKSTNPFAKLDGSTANPTGSILDSIKKMQTPDEMRKPPAGPKPLKVAKRKK